MSDRSAAHVGTLAEAPMTPEQRACLKTLAHKAFEPEAYGEDLTRAEAARRIRALKAKLRLQDEPPHTL